MEILYIYIGCPKEHKLAPMVRVGELAPMARIG